MTASDEPLASVAGEDSGSPTAAPHAEEMKGTVELRFGRFASMTATGRATPAGLVSAALLVAAVLFPLTLIVRRVRR